MQIKVRSLLFKEHRQQLTIGVELLNVGAEGCKIKGGISREAQCPGVSGVFEVLALLKSFRWISEAFQVRAWASVFRYPIARKGEFFEDFA